MGRSLRARPYGSSAAGPERKRCCCLSMAEMNRVKGRRSTMLVSSAMKTGRTRGLRRMLKGPSARVGGGSWSARGLGAVSQKWRLELRKRRDSDGGRGLAQVAKGGRGVGRRKNDE